LLATTAEPAAVADAAVEAIGLQRARVRLAVGFGLTTAMMATSVMLERD
jgi:hypothetical protein